MTTLDFTELHRAHNDLLVDYATAIVRGDRHAAQDAASAAWERAWAQRHEWQDRGKPPVAWLQALTRYTALAELRDRWHVVENPGQCLDDLPPDPGTDLPGLADPETLSKLDEVFAWLSPGQADALRLYCIEGHNYDEAAQVMGVDVGTVRSHVCMGLKRVRRYFLGDGYAYAHECPHCGWPVRSVGHRSMCR